MFITLFSYFSTAAGEETDEVLKSDLMCEKSLVSSYKVGKKLGLKFKLHWIKIIRWY